MIAARRHLIPALCCALFGLLLSLPALAQSPALTFAYQGWTAAEQQVLSGYITTAYPVMESVYGPPSHSFTVTIVKDTTPNPFGGSYNASTNQIRIPPVADLTRDTYVLASLILRAFHDDLMFAFDAWETGFARAAALVVQMQVRPDFDPTVDVSPYLLPLYELFNQPALGNSTFFPASGYLGMAFWRIAMAQAAWLKVYPENPNFFRAFNAAYYAAAPPPSADLSALKQIAAGIAPTVEGVAFSDWYRRQYVLDTSVSLGQKLFVATIPFQQHVFLELDYFQTGASGNETPLNGTAKLRYIGYQGLNYFPEAGDTVPVSNGVGPIAPEFFNIDGSQRITIEASLGPASATTYFPYSVYGAGAQPNPFFGVVTDADSGTVGITLPGEAERTEPAVRGAFSMTLGEPMDFFARTALRFTDSSGRTYRRQINTGPGYYVPLISARPGQAVTLSHWFPAGSAMVGFPITPLASDEAVALSISPSQLLLAHWKPDLAGYPKYVYYPNTPPIQPSIGYWFKLAAGRTVNIDGIVPASDQDYSIHLLNGWNQVPSPFNAEIPLTRIRVFYPGKGTLAYTNARSRGWVSTPWRYVPGQGYVIASSIRAWESVWIYCFASNGLYVVLSPR